MRLLITIFAFLLTQLYISAQEEMNFLGHWSDTLVDEQMAYIHYNEVWGFEMNGREYGVIGSIYGTHIIDVMDPTNPEEVFFVEGAFPSTDVIHRDYHDSNGFLYAVCDEGPSTLQIMNLNYLPDSLPLVYDQNDLLVTSHNIFIDTTSQRLYHVGGSSKGAVTVFDISNPVDPIEYGFFSFDNNSISYAHDVYVRNDTAYLNCGKKGLVIADFTNMDSVTTIAVLGTEDYPESGYNHSGWITDDGKTYIMADETTYKDVKIVDISNLPEIEVLTTVNPGTDESHIPHNPIVKGDYVYIAYYNNGLQIWNIKDPSNPVLTNFYKPESGIDSWGVYPYLSSGNILISDVDNGLHIVSGIDSAYFNGTNDVVNFKELNIFPNPVVDYIRISNLDISNNASYQILNIEGKLLEKGIINVQESNIEIELPKKMLSGIYFLNIEAREDHYRATFFKK